MNRSGLNYIALTSVIQSSFENRTALCSVVYAKEQKDFCDQPLKDEFSIISAFERGERFFMMGSEQLWQMYHTDSNCSSANAIIITIKMQLTVLFWRTAYRWFLKTVLDSIQVKLWISRFRKDSFSGQHVQNQYHPSSVIHTGFAMSAGNAQMDISTAFMRSCLKLLGVGNIYSSYAHKGRIYLIKNYTKNCKIVTFYKNIKKYVLYINTF